MYLLSGILAFRDFIQLSELTIVIFFGAICIREPQNKSNLYILLYFDQMNIEKAHAEHNNVLV